jgi:hypothetical protein
MLLAHLRDTRHQLSRGELAVLLLVFLVFVEVEPIDPARVLLETCAEVDECLHLQKPGDGGIGQSTRTSDDMLFVLHLLPVRYQHLLWLVAIK